MNSISINVSMDPTELRNAAGVLEGIANVVAANQASIPGSETVIKTAAPAPADDDNTGTTTAASVGVELDNAGLPWDARIHAPSKLKLKREKTWKLKKNVDKALVATVEAELRATMLAAPAAEQSNVVDISTAAPAPTPAAPAPTPAAPETETLYQCADGKGYTHVALTSAGWGDAAIIALPVMETKPVQLNTSSDIAITFPEIMSMVTPALASGDITQVEIDAAYASVGLTSLPLLASRPDLIGAFKIALFGE